MSHGLPSAGDLVRVQQLVEQHGAPVNEQVDLLNTNKQMLLHVTPMCVPVLQLSEWLFCNCIFPCANLALRCLPLHGSHAYIPVAHVC